MHRGIFRQGIFEFMSEAEFLREIALDHGFFLLNCCYDPFCS